jgi:beta-glucosidase/6-phospho-beta-glucosidase/beta-galactosidase
LQPRLTAVQYPEDISARDFLTRMYTYAKGVGATQYFDAISFHPYTDGHSPDYFDSKFLEWSYKDSVPALRQVMQVNNDSSPIWITEFGYTTITPTNCVDCWDSVAVSETDQAKYLTSAIKIAQAWQGAEVAVWLYYGLIDKNSSSTSFDDHFGLFTFKKDNLIPKSAVSEFKSFTVASP